MYRSSIMKAQNFVSRLKFVLLCSFSLVSAETHWLVTEDGKVQALADSLLNMAKPHDFVQFLKQEELVHRIDEARVGLSNHKNLIDYYERKDDPMIEKKLMTTDVDCILAVKPLVEQDLFISTVMPAYRNGPEWFIIAELLKNVKRVANRDQAKVPTCSAHVDLPFSMSAFDHLDSVIKRANLSNSRENMTSILDPADWPSLADFGHAIETMLEEEPKSWVLHTMASYFWRIAGSSEQAVECLRRALHFAPRAYAATPLLSLGNVLHQSGRSRDAVAVLETAAVYDEFVSQTYFTLAHAYAVTLQYNQSTASFDKCLALDPNYPSAARHRAAVRCHQKLESTLEAQHQNLQKTVEEMQSYQVRLKSFHELREEAQHQAVDPSTKQDQNLVYDHFKYGPLPGLSCKWTVAVDGRRMDCSISDYPAYKQSKLARAGANTKKPIKPSTSRFPSGGQSVMVTQPMTKNMKRRFKVGGVIESDSIALQSSTNRTGENDEEEEEQQQVGGGEGLKMVPPPSSRTTNQISRPTSYESGDWPGDDQCPKILKQWSTSINNPPQLFPNLDRKGVESKSVLGTDTAEHPLPWFPPFCTQSNAGDSRVGSASAAAAGTPAAGPGPHLHLSCCDHLLGVQRAKNTDQSQIVPEPDLKQTLLSFSASKAQSEAEVGQRIATFLKSCPPENLWIGYNLAALYWRVVGVPSETTTCLRLALGLPNDQQPHPDPALFQLAQMVYNAGHRLDDAIALLHQALEADPAEPQTHYLIAHYYLLNENYESAAEHLVKCLDLDKNFQNATLLLKLARCQNRLLTTENLKTSKPEIDHTDADTDSDVQVPSRRNQSPLFNFRDIQDIYHNTLENYVIVKFPNTVVFKKGDLRGLGGIGGAQDSQSTPLDFDYFLNGGGPGQNEKLLPLKPGGIKEANQMLARARAEAKLSRKSLEKLAQCDQKKNVRESLKPLFDKYCANKDMADQQQQQSLFLPMAATTAIKNGHVIRRTPMTNRLWAALAASLMIDAPPITTSDCARLVAKVDPVRAVPTCLSLSAKGVNLKKYLTSDPNVSDDPVEPHCPVNRQPFSMWTMDHLPGFINRHNYTNYEPEIGLKQVFLTLLSGQEKEAEFENLANRIAVSLHALNWKNRQTEEALWVLASAAALYWRVKGRAAEALECLKLSLAVAPLSMKDLALVSMANIYHQGGYLNSALAAAVTALWISPHLVVVHFNLANIYLAMGAYDHASSFLYSTLSMQPKFEPAKDRLRLLKCLFLNVVPTKTTNNRILTTNGKRE